MSASNNPSQMCHYIQNRGDFKIHRYKKDNILVFKVWSNSVDSILYKIQNKCLYIHSIILNH